jgi:hypothetical protein
VRFSTKQVVPIYIYILMSSIEIVKQAVRWALVLLALLEWADALTGRADLPWSVQGMYSCL